MFYIIAPSHSAVGSHLFLLSLPSAPLQKGKSQGKADQAGAGFSPGESQFKTHADSLCSVHGKNTNLQGAIHLATIRNKN